MVYQTPVRKDSPSSDSAGSKSSGNAATIYTPKTPNFGEFGPIERPTPGTAPRSKGKAVTFHPDIFHPEAPAFKPADAITFLNNDSEPDVATPTHKLAQTTANIGRAVKPLGAGKLTSSNSSKSPNVLHQGPPFTTDQEAWVSGSRYVDIGNIPIHWAETNYIMRALVSTGITGQLISTAVAEAVPPNGTVHALLWFRDLRDAAACNDTFSMVLTTATFEYLTHEEFTRNNPDRTGLDEISPYYGQVEFSTQYIGPTRDFNLEAIMNKVRRYAESFGEVCTIALIEDCTINSPRFRVEYFDLAHAELACPEGDVREDIEFDDDDIVATIRPFHPENGQHYTHPALFALHPSNGNIRRSEPKQVKSRPRSTLEQNNLYRGGHQNALQPFEGTRHNMNSNNGYASGAYAAPEYRNTRRPNVQYERPYGNIAGMLLDTVDWDVVDACRPEDINNQPQMVLLRDIMDGIDVRTTVMIRNIPNKLDAAGLKSWLDETSHGLYDFAYLRVDFSNDCNVGYAFVNFSKPEYIVHFVEERVGKPWNLFGSEKSCEVSYATIQGQDCLVAKFRNSSVMQEWEGYRPKVFYSYDTPDVPEDKSPGDQAPFPGPDNLTKLQRSLDNANAVGLYPPRHGHGGRGNDRRYRSQYDRGTPAAIQEERAQLGATRFHGTPRMFDDHASMGEGRMVWIPADPRAPRTIPDYHFNADDGRFNSGISSRGRAHNSGPARGNSGHGRQNFPPHGSRQGFPPHGGRQNFPPGGRQDYPPPNDRHNYPSSGAGPGTGGRRNNQQNRGGRHGHW